MKPTSQCRSSPAAGLTRGIFAQMSGKLGESLGDFGGPLLVDLPPQWMNLRFLVVGFPWVFLAKKLKTIKVHLFFPRESVGPSRCLFEN